MTDKTIVILDDEADRINAMLPCLAREYPGTRTVVFDNATDMIGWLRENLTTALVICLDHDLGPNRSRGGVVFEPGTGRDVVDYLATQPPACPIILHTTNHLAVPGMQRVLEESGWPVSRVAPYADLEWIDPDWINEVRSALDVGRSDNRLEPS